MGSDTYDSQKPLHGKYFNFAFINSAASPRSPGLNFFVVHQRSAGLPREIHKVFAFCLLPSRQAAILCHQMDQVPVCGMRRSRFREGKSHGLFLNIHTCENPLPWQCLTTKCEIGGSIFWRPPGARFKVQLQPPCWMIWDLLCLECENDQNAFKRMLFLSLWNCRINFQYKVWGAIHGWSGLAGYTHMIPLW